MTTQDYLKDLNKEQREAVEYVEGPIIVFAGAGTGKTKTLTTRIAYMINDKKIAPHHILAITFTKKASNEMRERVNKLTGDVGNKVAISTIHAFCAKVLRFNIQHLGYKQNFEIIDDEEGLKIISEIYKEHNLDRKYLTPKTALNMIGDYKNGMAKLVGVADKVYELYQDYLFKNNLVDFDDLLILTKKLFEENAHVLEEYQYRYQYSLVDEFQDTNHIQYDIIKLLAGEKQNVFVVGDDDQSIYSFRGASVDNMYLFMEEYHNVKIVKLVQNYRSTNILLKGSNSLIACNECREPKELYSDVPGDIHDIVINESYYFEDEARFVSSEIKSLHNKGYNYSDIAVLYRNNVIARNFELAFIENQIPYVIYGGISYLKRREIKDVVSYLHFIIDHNNFLHFKRIINQPSRGIGEKTIQKVKMLMDEENISLFEAIDKVNEINASTKTQALIEFKNLINDLTAKINEMPLGDFFDELIDKTGYLEMVKAEDNVEVNREANLKEFKSILFKIENNYDGENNIKKLEQGFDDIILDESIGVNTVKDSVVLSTIHSIKGLEFKVVFVVALEEGIFPSMRDESDIEEERRVAYVAFTRAKEKVYLTCATRRLIYGRIVKNHKSRFLSEYLLPKELSEKKEPSEEKAVDDGIIRVGDKVYHSNFGEGLVISSDDMTIQILFDKDHSLRKIMKNHPAITKARG